MPSPSPLRGGCHDIFPHFTLNATFVLTPAYLDVRARPKAALYGQSTSGKSFRLGRFINGMEDILSLFQADCAGTGNEQESRLKIAFG